MERPCLEPSSRIGHHVAMGLAANVLVAIVVAAPCSAAETAATLQWKNGDELLGQIVGATKNRLIWRSAALSQDISLDLAALASIHFPNASAAEASADTLQCHLKNGDVLAGTLKGIAADYVLLDSTRHGIVSIRKAWVARIRRSGVFNSVDLVDTRGRGWRSLDSIWRPKQPVLADWKTDEPGQITTSSPGARLFLGTSLPDSCHIELEIASTSRPAFSLAIGSIDQLTERSGVVELETWGDELVVQSASSPGDFEHLVQVNDDNKQLHLHVFWDRTTGKISVYDAHSKRWTNFAAHPDSEAFAGGVLLENKGRDVTVKRLTIDNWIGDLQPRQVAGQDRIRTLDGREFYGTISGPDTSGQLVVNSDGKEKRIPTKTIAEAILHHPTAVDAPASTCEMRFTDGSRLQGDLLSITEGLATLAFAYSRDPIRARIDGLNSCKFLLHAPAEEYGSQHVLEYRGLRLHGNLAAAGSDLGWRPIGSADAIPLQTGVPWLIERVEARSDPAADAPTKLDVLHLRNGDQVPCRVHTIDEQFVKLDTQVSPAGKVPQAEVRAIEFEAESASQVSGFADRRWQIPRKQAKAIHRTPDQIVFQGPSQITHPDLLKGGMFEFDVDWSRDAQIVFTITLNSSDAASAAVRQLGRVVRAAERQLFYFVFTNDQVMVHSMSGRSVRQQNVHIDVAASERLRIRCEVHGKSIELSANGDTVGSLPLSRAGELPSGVVIACQRIKRTQKQQNSQPTIAISNMHAGRAAGLFRSIGIDQSERKHVLTVPRSRRNRPPTHVLLAANGDLLRGELIVLAPGGVQFRSLMDDVIIPRSRLSGIVWLDDDEAPSDRGGKRTGQVQATFRNGVVLEFSPESIVEDKIVGRHDLLGVCHLSLDAVDKLRSGRAESKGSAATFSEWTLVSAREPVIPDAQSGSSFGTQSTLIGQQAEDFELELLGGQRFRLRDHTDKVVVLDFWTTWCGPCIQALPELMVATSQFSPEDVLFVAVNQQESAAVIREFLDAHDWTFTVALDEEGQVGQKYQLEGYPQTVVIGRGGRIEHVRLGFSPNLQSELIETLNELLNETETAAD